MTAVQKNDCYTVTIEDMSTDGEGIGKVDGYTLFVKDALIGDLVQAKITMAKKNFAFARVEEILRPSKDRVEPRCVHHRRCGGCQIQALSYERQLAFKKEKIENNLKRIGGLDVTVEEVIGMDEPFHYRNKTQIPFGRDKDGRIVAGFYAGRTHTIIDCEDCALCAPVVGEIIRRIKRFLKEAQVEPYDEVRHEGILRHALVRTGTYSGEIMVCLVICAEALPKQEKLISLLTEVPGMTSISVNVNKTRTNVIMGNKVRTIWGRDAITDRIGNLEFEISPLSFFQVNTKQTEKLYGKALEFAGLDGGETVWDLYCGIGTISLFLAQKAKQVYGVEIVPEAIADARKNAERNGLANVEFFVGKSEEILPQKHRREGVRADVIVVDPPRKGCEETLLETIAQIAPERVVYVSCNSATLARDLKYLTGRGFEVVRCVGVDMFGETVHVETIVLLSHKSPDSHINVKVEFGEGEGKVPLDAIAERAKKYQPKPKITYKMIQEYVEKKYGFKVHTAYIAEVKRSLGLTMYGAPNAVDKLKQPRKRPPQEKKEAITETLKYFGVI